MPIPQRNHVGGEIWGRGVGRYHDRDWSEWNGQSESWLISMKWNLYLSGSEWKSAFYKFTNLLRNPFPLRLNDHFSSWIRDHVQRWKLSWITGMWMRYPYRVEKLLNQVRLLCENVGSTSVNEIFDRVREKWERWHIYQLPVQLSGI